MAYTTIDDPTAYFQVKTYTGNYDTNAITLDGASNLQGDLIWLKQRDGSDGWHCYDSVRGVAEQLRIDDNRAESTTSGILASFNTDGFTLGANNAVNEDGTANVGFVWKGGTAHSNDQSATGVGDIDSDGNANTTAGFSIAKFTTSGTSVQTVAHGLGAVPDMYIAKGRANGTSWFVYHKDMGNTHRISLDTTAAKVDNTMWGDTSPTSTLFSINPDNFGATTSIGYFFKSIQGYSKVGSSYVGNGNADGPFVYTGFAPIFVLRKSVDTAYNWLLQDWERFDRRNTAATNRNLAIDVADAEPSSAGFSGNPVDFLSNGFKIRAADGTGNKNTDTYIYMAFAEAPFVNSNGVPCNAR